MSQTRREQRQTDLVFRPQEASSLLTFGRCFPAVEDGGSVWQAEVVVVACVSSPEAPVARIGELVGEQGAP